MNNDEALAAVTSEMDDVMESRDSDDVTRLSIGDVDSLPVLGE